MLRISKLADYAIVVMNSIATHPGQLHSAKDIAVATKLAEPTVSKVLKLLTKQQLLSSQRGSKGGYVLVCPAENITVAEIIEAIDGEIAMTECDKSDGCCAVASSCTVSNNWQKISGAIRRALSNISLAEMQNEIPETLIQFNFKRPIKS